VGGQVVRSRGEASRAKWVRLVINNPANCVEGWGRLRQTRRRANERAGLALHASVRRVLWEGGVEVVCGRRGPAKGGTLGWEGPEAPRPIFVKKSS
jgi:hypothetical protein